MSRLGSFRERPWQWIGLGFWCLVFGALVWSGCPTDAHADSTTITVHWTAPGDDGDVGTASTYQLRWSEARPTTDFDGWWNAALPVLNLPAPAPAGSPQSVTVRAGFVPGVTYYFLLRAADEVGNWSVYSNTAAAQIQPDPVPPRPIVDLHLGPSVPGSPTHMWVRVEGTGADPVVRYEARTVDGNGVTVWVPPLRDTTSTASAAPVPPAPGQTFRAWLYWPKHNSMPILFWLVGVAANGMRSDSSNAIALRAGTRADTTHYDQSTGYWFRSRPDGIATYARELGDNRWTRLSWEPWSLAPILSSQEELQLADRPALFALFGGYRLGDGWHPKP